MPAIDSTTLMDLHSNLPLHSGDVHCVVVTDKYLVTTSGDKTIRVFNTSNLTEKSYSPLNIHKYHVISCRVTPSGDRLICTSMDGKSSVVDLSSGKLLATFCHPNGTGMRTCAVSRDGQLFAVGAVDGTITIIEAETYKPLKSMSMNDDESVLSLTFSPDSHWLISGHSVTGDLRIWNAAYLSKKYCGFFMMAHELGTHYLDMSPNLYSSPDSSRKIYRFVSGGEDSMICIWELSYEEYDDSPKLTKINTLVGHTAPVYCVKFTPDSENLISCGGDQTVRLWNMEGECVYVHVDAHRSFINSCTFNPDMKLVYTGSSDKTVKVWRLTDTFGLREAGMMTSSSSGDNVIYDNPATITSTVQALVGNGQRPATHNRGNSSMNVSYWSVDDVCLWLGQLGLSKYADTFHRNEIDGRELMSLNGAILDKELGIGAYGARNKIMQGVQELFASRTVAENANAENAENTDLPNEFLCPITHLVMNDPVVASDGYSYERRAIQSWLSSGKTTSPMTNAELDNLTLVANHTLRAVIHSRTLRKRENKV